MPLPAGAWVTINTARVGQDKPATRQLGVDIISDLEYAYAFIKSHVHRNDDTAELPGVSQGVNIAAATIKVPNTTAINFGGDLCRHTPTFGLALAWQSGGTPRIHMMIGAGGCMDWNGNLGGSLIQQFVFGGMIVQSETNYLAQPISLLTMKDAGTIIKTGSYVGNGAGSQAITTNFDATGGLTIIYGPTATKPVMRTKSHTGSNSRKTDGTNTTTGITAVSSTGFTAGSSYNTNLQTYYYIQIAPGTENGERISLETYNGDGATPRSLTDCGQDIGEPFDPQMAIIVGGSSNTRMPAIAFRAMQPNRSWHGNDTAASAQGIREFLENGIVIGSDSDVNQAGESFDVYYIQGGTAYTG